MAESACALDENVVLEVKHLLWGKNLQDDVFLRWTQGFVFSEHESTALVQYEGGPCAVIAPVQGFVLKNALFSENKKDDLAQASAQEATEFLNQSLCDILLHVSSGTYSILSFNNEIEEQRDHSTNSNQLETGNSSYKASRMGHEDFHSKLRCTNCSDEETMRRIVKTNIAGFMGVSGVLLYLYSIVITKGIQQIKNEVEDPGEPLIDSKHGHGSQSLINLLITGKAVSNVWDNDKDISGLKLQGVSRRADIGFMSYLEHYRYCEVGWYLKNPNYPVWLIGSETHLTVLFSRDSNLIINESLETQALRMFRRFDPEGNGFIASSLLGDLLEALELVSEKEYVDIMISKLDEENLGIITQSSFMKEFYPGEKIESPESFILYHYNGIARSNHDNKVQYVEGKAILRDEFNTQMSDVSPIKLCLLTKWPTIEITWQNNNVPSLN